MRTKTLLAAVLIVAVLIAVFLLINRNGSGGGNTTSGPAVTLGERTKTTGCAIAGALPDHACTPGAAFAGVTADQICRSGYARSVRDVPTEEKTQVYAEYGIATRRSGQYEVDHLVSLELGGSNDIANLWPEAADPKPGFHEKDRYENYLHDQVCSGRLSLQEAQRRIAQDWLSNWREIGSP
jgi:hypothetical protein